MVSDIQHTFEEAEKEFVELQKVHDQLKAQIETHSHYRVATSRMLEKDLSTLMFESKVRCYGPALPFIDPADIFLVHATLPLRQRSTPLESHLQFRILKGNVKTMPFCVYHRFILKMDATRCA